MTFRTLLVGCALWCAPAFADAGTDLDAGDLTPDASVGTGGPDMMEEGENMTNGVCSLTRDCERGFACVNGVCKYVGYRQATQGCSAAPSLAMVAAGALLVLARRKR